MPLLLIMLGVGIWAWAQKGKEFLAQYKIKFIDAIFNNARTQESFYTKFFFTIRVEVDNITDFTGTLDSAKLRVSYNNKLLGTVEKREPVTIIKNGKTKVEIPVAIPTLNLVSNIATIVKAITDNKKLVFNIAGDLNFAMGKVTVNENYPVAL